ncbi:MAG: glycoside hydrolase family 3 N-terminal domain-containing protein [Bryobacteraceae bacterium]|nr:glycoside hydrolase family 3 N-terminal domain-containing protein [Bryobacteraceae bacterium]
MIKNALHYSCTVLAVCSGLLLVGSGAAAPRAKVKPLSSYDPQVKALLAKMTIQEKVGQMTQPDISALKDPSDIENLFLGSLLSGGDADPKAGNSIEAWTDMYDEYQKHTSKTRLQIPILYGVDALHGHNNVLGAVIFPHNIGLGCARNAALVEKIGRITAEEVRATGIQWAFAPCVTVPQDIRWGRTYEGFSSDPALVKVLGEAAVRGLQMNDLSNPLGVLACAKHYLADGGTAFGTGLGGKKSLDQGDSQIDEATLRQVHLQGYLTTVKAGVGTIMPSYSSWNGTKMSAQKYLLTDVLKKELGFEGFVISDYNAIDEIGPDYKKDVEISVNAGMDMVMIAGKHRQFVKDLLELVQEGKVPMSRIDDAVTRILRVKFAMGLMDKSRSQLADRGLQKDFGSPAHRAVAREAVRQSLVVLKNDNKALPISKKIARIHVAGKSADNLGNQCGGWTINWQGKTGNVTPGGTTILAAIQGAVSKDTKVTFSADGTGAEGASLGVVVIGERPYAEGNGDRTNLALDQADQDAIANVKKAGIPVVVVLLSGRPMILGDALDKADAFVAAWLPGTEGQGVTDVLFGDFKPAGKLSFAWPKSMDQIPVKTGDTKTAVLFPLGYGLKF